MGYPSMRVLFLIIIVGTVAYIEYTQRIADLHVDENKRLMVLINTITKYGYPVEYHNIVTDDGYVLGTFRIPYGKKENQSSKGLYREPILINPPYFSTSGDFFSVLPDEALPFLYADAGFDVWLGNFRGNSFSALHLLFSTSDLAFWNFGFDEIAMYDVPNQIDYILKVTGSAQLVYYGFSQGGGMILLTLARKPEYNLKVRRMTIAAPSGFCYNTQSVFFNHGIPFKAVQMLLNYFSIGRICGIKHLQHAFANVCKFFPSSCYYILQLLQEENPGQIKKETLWRIFHSIPDQTSAMSYIHALQWTQTGRIQYFDYGEEQNTYKYGSSIPIDYNFDGVTVPVCALLGVKDAVIVPIDALKTLSGMQSWCNPQNPWVEDPKWRHLDTMFGKDAGKLVYSRSIKFHLQGDSTCSC